MTSKSSDNPTGSRLVILSGPSGAGKSTVVRKLLATSSLPLVLSVSATTRSPRDGERDGVDYHFLTRDEFAQRRAAGEFLECKEVFGRGDWYGTLRDAVTTGLAQGKWVLLEIDVQGALAVVEEIPAAITIFVRPDSLAELERRLRGRRTETEDVIQRRLQVARQELELAQQYRHQVVNQTVDQTVAEINEILVSSGNADPMENEAC